MGAGVKGRSRSRMLWAIWRRTAAWFLGAGLYPGFHWVWGTVGSFVPDGEYICRWEKVFPRADLFCGSQLTGLS